jgi:hypothetical protein
METREFGSVEALYDLSPKQVDETALLLREGGRLLAVRYLQKLVRHSELDHVATFLDQVISGGADASTWGRQDQFCTVDDEIGLLVQLSFDDFTRRVSGVGAGNWIRVVPLIAAWDYTAFCGAPGFLVRMAPYWWTCPDGLTCIDAATEILEPVDSLRVVFRRWLASRIAWALRAAPIPSTLDEMRQRLGATSVSTDARIAMLSLLAEEQEARAGLRSKEANELAPGFRGADNLFHEEQSP